jgi:hypothetical protein
MNHATLRDFFLVAPKIYEAVGRLAAQNFKPGPWPHPVTGKWRSLST